MVAIKTILTLSLTFSPIFPGGTPRDRARQRPTSVIADTGVKGNTAQLLLTEELLTRYIALKKDLAAFWQDSSHKALHDSAQAHRHTATIRVLPDNSPASGPRTTTVGTFDYVAITAHDSTLAAIFKKHDILPSQFELTQIAAWQAMMNAEMKRVLGSVYKVVMQGTAPDEASVAGKNMALAAAHRADLLAVGVVGEVHASVGSDDGGSLAP